MDSLSGDHVGCSSVAFMPRESALGFSPLLSTTQIHVIRPNTRRASRRVTMMANVFEHRVMR